MAMDRPAAVAVCLVAEAAAVAGAVAVTAGVAFTFTAAFTAVEHQWHEVAGLLLAAEKAAGAGKAGIGAAAEVAEGLSVAEVGLGRIVALYCCSSTSYKIH